MASQQAAQRAQCLYLQDAADPSVEASVESEALRSLSARRRGL